MGHLPTLRRREVWALAAAVTAVVAVGLLPLMAPVDALAVRWLQAYGGRSAHRVAHWLDDEARTSLLMIAFVTIAVARIRGRDLAASVVTLGLGAFVGELLKTAIERPRPSAPVGVLIGNSLPSGHIMNTTMAAVLVCSLAWRTEWSPRAKRIVVAAAAVAVVAQSCGRMMRGSHWPSDVVPSILLGTAWMLGAGRLLAAPRRWSLAAVALLVLAYGVFYGEPSWRLRLPAVARVEDGFDVTVIGTRNEPERLQSQFELEGERSSL